MTLADDLRRPPSHKMVTPAKVLTFDIERRPGVYLEWAPRNQGFMGRDKQLIRSSTISFSAKWYDQRGTIYHAIAPVDSMFMQPEDVPGYREMLVALYDLLNQADIVVGFNSARFDQAKVLGEFARLGLGEPSPFRTLDIMRTTKRMGWDYSSLAETLSALGLEGKLAHQGFQLWVDFLRGDTKAHKTMEKYNRQDVVQTERAMDALRPYIKDHPNLGLWAGQDDNGDPLRVCPKCASPDLHIILQKDAATALTRYPLYSCGKCGTRDIRGNHVKERVSVRTAR